MNLYRESEIKEIADKCGLIYWKDTFLHNIGGGYEHRSNIFLQMDDNGLKDKQEVFVFKEYGSYETATRKEPLFRLNEIYNKVIESATTKNLLLKYDFNDPRQMTVNYNYELKLNDYIDIVKKIRQTIKKYNKARLRAKIKAISYGEDFE